jgi:uncharacterized protein YndB with AHSA1/START domain
MNTPYTATASITVNAPAPRVWEALTKPELIKQYLFGTNVATDWKEGSAISYKGEWEGKQYEDKGTILKIIPEKLIVSTYWSSMGGSEDKPENYMTVTYALEPDGAATKLTITQENAPTQDSAEHSGENWKMVLEGLKKVVEG